jgi:hypothetical protein
MKFLLSFLFGCLWQVSFSQITLTELQKILKMDQSKFETYCLLNKYELSEYINDTYESGSEYVKGYGSNTKYLKLFDYFYKWGKTVQYQINNSNEYLSLKSGIINSGYKVFNTSVLENGYKYVDYSNSIYVISIATGKDPTSNLDFYEVSMYCK